MDRKNFLYEQLKQMSGGACAPCVAPGAAERASRSQLEETLAAEIAARRARGEGFSAIASDLNRRGIKGRNGGRWYHVTVRRLGGVGCSSSYGAAAETKPAT